MRKFLIPLLLAPCCHLSLAAQDSIPVRPVPAVALPVWRGPGSVRYIEDPDVTRTMQRFVEVKHERKGFRVQIALGDRRTAEDTKRSFLLKHPDTPAYISWFAPNFRLRVGDLRTRLEAVHLLQELKPEHPGSYIVPDLIEPPRVPAVVQE
jgi:hypothetical protein